MVGEIIRRFETRGLKLVGLKMLQVDRFLAERGRGERFELIDPYCGFLRKAAGERR